MRGSEIGDGKVIRRGRRYRLFVPAQLNGATAVQQGYLLDLSITGGQVRVAAPPAPGTIVTLTSCGIKRPARVAWVNDRRLGLAFVAPLSMEEVARVTSA